MQVTPQTVLLRPDVRRLLKVYPRDAGRRTGVVLVVHVNTYFRRIYFRPLIFGAFVSSAEPFFAAETGKKAFLPVEPPPKADLSFLFLLGRTQFRLTPLLILDPASRGCTFLSRRYLGPQEYRLRHNRPASLSRPLRAPCQLYPQPVSGKPRGSCAPIVCSPAASAMPSLPNEKYATAYFSVRKRT